MKRARYLIIAAIVVAAVSIGVVSARGPGAKTETLNLAPTSAPSEQPPSSQPAVDPVSPASSPNAEPSAPSQTTEPESSAKTATPSTPAPSMQQAQASNPGLQPNADGNVIQSPGPVSTVCSAGCDN